MRLPVGIFGIFQVVASIMWGTDTEIKGALTTHGDPN